MRIRLFTLMQIQIRLFIFVMRTWILVFDADPDSILHTSPDPLQSEKPPQLPAFYFDPDPVFQYAADLDTATENYADPDSRHWQQKHPLRGSIQLFRNKIFLVLSRSGYRSGRSTTSKKAKTYTYSNWWA
jgi:hypothetical protein